MPLVFSFDDWKKLLLTDCVARDKELAFNSLGDSVLRVLYESGVDPTVKALSADSDPKHTSA